MKVYDAQKRFLDCDELELYRAIVHCRGYTPERPVDTERLFRRHFYLWTEAHFDIVLEALLRKGIVVEEKEEPPHMEIGPPVGVFGPYLYIKRGHKIIRSYELLDTGQLRRTT